MTYNISALSFCAQKDQQHKRIEELQHNSKQQQLRMCELKVNNDKQQQRLDTLQENNNKRQQQIGLKNWRTQLTVQFASLIVGVWYSDVGMGYVKFVHLGCRGQIRNRILIYWCISYQDWDYCGQITHWWESQVICSVTIYEIRVSISILSW